MTKDEVMILAHNYSTMGPEHLATMVPKMEAMNFNEPKEREKLMRWLGFMQGVLWERQVYSLDELRSHNKYGLPDPWSDVGYSTGKIPPYE